MELFEAYKTDPTVENEGVWIPFPRFGGLKIRLARAGGGNKQWEVERERALRPLRKRYRNETIPDSEVLDALMDPFCKIILLDWEGLVKNGKVIDCTYKNKISVCKSLPDFYAELVNEAGQRDYYLESEAEEEAGKSQSGSSGMPNTKTPEGP